LHKSVVIYLKNIFLNKSGNFTPEELFQYLRQIFELIFSQNKYNQNLNNQVILNIIQSMITNLSSSQKISSHNSFSCASSLSSIEIKMIQSSDNKSFANNSLLFIKLSHLLCLYVSSGSTKRSL